MYIQKYFLLLLFTVVFSNNISISPQFSYKYESDNEQYAFNGATVQDFELIFIGKYKNSKLNILTQIGYHFIDGRKTAPSDFSQIQGLDWVSQPSGLYSNQGNYYIANMQTQYGDDKLSFYLNKWNKHWGPGINSLILSKNIPPFFHFGFKWKTIDHVNFEYFHGRLNSEIPDTNYSSYYNKNSRNYYVMRNIVGHRLEWSPSKSFILSASETVIYSNRSIEPIYLLPFVPFFSLQQYIGEIDNIIMSGDVQYFLKNNIRLYGVLLIDEWAPPFTFQLDNRNWFGYQVGMELDNMLIPNSKLHFEYTWTDHRIYRHRFSVNNYYSYEFPVGFWAGPHAEEFYLGCFFNIQQNEIFITYSKATRGELTNEMLSDQYSRPKNNPPPYERFNGILEKKHVFSISINRKLMNNLNVSISYQYIDWENAENRFNVDKGALIMKNGLNIIKNSFGFNFQYNY